MSEEEVPAVVDAPAIVRSKRKQWLARRRELITASDVAAILGVDPFRRPSDVYMEKLGLAETTETEPMRWGKRMEDAIADGYIAATRRRVHAEPAYEIALHRDIPWLGATLDRGVTTDGYSAEEPGEAGPLGPADLGALELKCTSAAGAWDDEPPVAYQIQLTVQMAVTARSWGSLAAFVSLYRPVAWFDRTFDEHLFGLMVPKLEEFRAYVLRREPPIDPAWFSHDAIRRIWQTDTGETIDLSAAHGPRALQVVEAWEQHREAEAEAKRAKEEAEDELRVLLGSAKTGKLGDGTSLTWKTVPATIVKEYRREAYRILRRFQPKGLVLR